MLVIRDAYQTSDLPKGGIVTIGNYDGIHRAHQAVIERVVERARDRDVPAVVVTFEPHPLAVVRPQEAPPRLTSLEQKERLVAATGADALLVVDFDDEMAGTPAEEFVRSFLVGGLELVELHVGEDFRLGHRREGSLETLERLGREIGFAVHIVDEVRHGGERISSTRIRRAVAEGRMGDATELLGRPYSVSGRVVKGDRMGQRLGWPTINLEPASELVPGDGVYAGRAHFPDIPSTFDCVTNVGTRPTVYENYQRVVESHILDFSTDVYGEPVEVSFHKRLREERIFPSVMDLSAQIRRDVEATREFFAAERHLEETAR
jgi:riboflavin kinase/FMN adenylyltransferase